jgi:4-hydroxyproline epimerase
MTDKIPFIDSHTGGEPTRVLIDTQLALGEGTVADQLQVLRTQHDHLRTAALNEPRGNEVIVGALLCEPSDRSCTTGVIFFNNVGYLGMCGHGTIGVVETLRWMNRVQPGVVRIETSVGIVSATLHEDGRVSVRNVPSYRKTKGVAIDVPGIGSLRGDVAWGGNWFFLVEEHGFELTLNNVEQLTDTTWRIRQAINAQGYPEVDHIELFGPPQDAANHSRNFVLCPGKAYDRSPCGTGTSAKLACLVADGKLKPGDVWRQESIIGSVFEGSVELINDEIFPTVTGRAWVTCTGTLVLDNSDPFRFGIR